MRGPCCYAALGCFVAAAICGALAQGYGGLLLAAALAGLGNSPFHPVDFTILNHRVSQPRLGHAFAVHGISGNVGWAVAPVVLLGVTGLTGSWRWALAACALWALAVLALMLWQHDAVDDRAGQRGAARAAATSEPALAFLRLPSVWLCFFFFFFSTCALTAILSFAGPALQKMYALPLAAASFVVTGYMLCGIVGLLLGGFLAARAVRLERTIGLCLALAAALLALVGTGWLPGALAIGVAAFAGLGTGLAGPSRDMLIKRASPPGATGRVYGTVYSGLDLGFALAAPVFGAVLDGGNPQRRVLRRSAGAGAGRTVGIDDRLAPGHDALGDGMTPARLAGHALVEALIAQGIDTAFGVPGESYLAVLDGFHEHREQIRFIACRHEGGAAFMAEAQGKLAGWPGVCLVTRGPGASNAAIGLHTAFQDSTPMVLLVGQVASDQRDREAFQELDYRQVFGPGTLGMAKWVAEVQQADRLPEYVARAFHTAMQGRPGPVVLVLPEDMLTASTAAAVLPRAVPAQAWPAPGVLRDLRAMLARARAPAGDRRRIGLDRGKRARAAAFCRGLAVAGRLRLSLPGHLRQPPSACTPATSASASTRSSPRGCARPTWSWPSACAWAR